MVIIFQNKKARDFLLRRRFVYSFRKVDSKYRFYDWMTDKRGGKKIADVLVNLYDGVFCSPIEEVLGKYVTKSGFKTVGEWLDAIREFNGGRVPATGYIYYVQIRKRVRSRP